MADITDQTRFDFLGYHFGPAGLCVASKTVAQFIERAIRLYEQEPGEAFASARLGLYVQRWFRWAWGDCGQQPIPKRPVPPRAPKDDE